MAFSYGANFFCRTRALLAAANLAVLSSIVFAWAAFARDADNAAEIMEVAHEYRESLAEKTSAPIEHS